MKLKLLALLLLFSMDNTYFYRLNKNRKRTSSLLRRGNIYGKVIKVNDEHVLNLKIYIETLFNSKKAKREIKLPNDIFSEDYWTNLRNLGSVRYDDFLITHLEVLGACDKVLMNEFEDYDDLKDMEIESVICHEENEFKPLNLDIKGIFKSYNFKAGFDLIPE